jgi:hypothetical protein
MVRRIIYDVLSNARHPHWTVLRMVAVPRSSFPYPMEVTKRCGSQLAAKGLSGVALGVAQSSYMSRDDKDVVWHPSPNRRRLVLRWTVGCLVAGAVVAGAWSLRGHYPRIVLTGTPGPAKQVQAQVEPMDVGTPKGRIVDKKPPAERRPPLDTRSVVRTVPTE